MSIFGTGIPKFQFYPGDAGLTFTVNTTSELVTSASAHDLKTGDAIQVSSATTLPAPLAASTDYYVIYNTSTTFKLAITRANAYSDTEINLTTTGTGTHTLTRDVEVSLTNAKIIKDEAAPEILTHKSNISGHISHIPKGQHWDFDVLIHLYKNELSQHITNLDAGTDKITMALSYAADEPVFITSTGNVPTGLSKNTIYYTIFSSATENQLSLIPGGSAIDFSAGWTGVLYLISATNAVKFTEYRQYLNREVALWRHSDGYPFMVDGVTDKTSLATTDYAYFYLESISPVYITDHNHKDGLKLSFKSVDWVDLFHNAGAF